MPSFDEFEQLLRNDNLMVSAPELHGVLSGLICGGIDSDTWLPKINDLVNDGHGLPITVKKETQALFNQAMTQLNGDKLDFCPLQPDDDVSIRERLEALALWVQSFLVGFGVMRTDLNKIDPEIKELIHDFSEISQLSVELDGNSNDNEQAFIEVFEYVRLGAIACFEQFKKHDKPSSPILH